MSLRCGRAHGHIRAAVVDEGISRGCFVPGAARPFSQFEGRLHRPGSPAATPKVVQSWAQGGSAPDSAKQPGSHLHPALRGHPAMQFTAGPARDGPRLTLRPRPGRSPWPPPCSAPWSHGISQAAQLRLSKAGADHCQVRPGHAHPVLSRCARPARRRCRRPPRPHPHPMPWPGPSPAADVRGRGPVTAHQTIIGKHHKASGAGQALPWGRGRVHKAGRGASVGHQNCEM